MICPKSSSLDTVCSIENVVGENLRQIVRKKTCVRLPRIQFVLNITISSFLRHLDSIFVRQEGDSIAEELNLGDEFRWATLEASVQLFLPSKLDFWATCVRGRNENRIFGQLLRRVERRSRVSARSELLMHQTHRLER